MTVWKFPIKKLEPVVKIEMPRQAKVLTVQLQNEVPCIWALIDPHQEKTERLFTIAGTGHNTNAKAEKYIGTFQVGPYVWHLFDGVFI